MTTIVFLHGAYGAATDFDEIRHAVLARVTATATPDTPVPTLMAFNIAGHGPVVADPSTAGATAQTLTSSTTSAVCAADSDDVDGLFEQAAFLIARAIEGIAGDVILVGYSLGARVALGATLLQPALTQNVRRLVLVSGTAGLADEGTRDERRALDDDRAAAFAADPVAHLADFWRLPLFSDLAGHDGLTSLLLARQERASSQTALRARWMRGLSVARMPALWPLLSSLTIPVDLVVGANDHDYVEAANRFRNSVPAARLHLVPGVKHALPILAPTAIVDVITTILSEPA
ncbi:MAG TPA: alpha/beta fold hydrolase [Myxococcota bacterium]